MLFKMSALLRPCMCSYLTVLQSICYSMCVLCFSLVFRTDEFQNIKLLLQFNGFL